MVVSENKSDGRVMVLASDVLEVPMIRVDGDWSVGTFSADDLKDNFNRVEGKAATALLNEAKAAFSSNPSRFRAEFQAFSSNPDRFTKSHKQNSPAADWAEQSTKRALDELFNATYAYRSSQGFYDLMQFVRHFRFYSPYNAFLIHIQRPGATFVAPPTRWNREYGRTVKPNANPIVILQPMGPVMFVFDVSDTEEGPDARPLPAGVDKPYEVLKGELGDELWRTKDNAIRDGIRIHEQELGSQAAGSIHRVDGGNLPKLKYEYGKDKEGYPINYEVPVRYEVVMNMDLSPESQYATLAHELAHLYCGHLGTPNKKWWPDRCGLSDSVVEFEAEAVSYLVCSRIGIDTPSATYLIHYIGDNKEVPRISLECLMKAAGIIESMGQKRLKPRKD